MGRWRAPQKPSSPYITPGGAKALDIELKHLDGRIREMGYKMKVSAKAKDHIIDKGWDEQFGARPLKRAIQKYIEDELAEQIIKAKLKQGDVINVGYNSKKEQINITFTTPKK